MASSSKFQGAPGNLRRVFEHNRKRYSELNSAGKRRAKELSPHQQRVADIKSFSVKFLHLMDMLYNLNSEKRLGGEAGSFSFDVDTVSNAPPYPIVH